MAPWMVLGGPFTAPRIVRGGTICSCHGWSRGTNYWGDHPLCDITIMIIESIVIMEISNVCIGLYAQVHVF